ncbi:hypothetical protein vseg_008290 [Gypsophila vaccaria]
MEFHEKEESRKRMAEVMVKERQNEERRKAVEEEENRVWKRSVEADERDRELTMRLEAVELVKRLNDERSGAIQLEKDRIIKERFELEKREKRIEERVEVLEAKERGIEERFAVVEAKEKAIEERCGVFKSEEDRIANRCLELGKREKEIEERFEVVEVLQKEIKALILEAESKEREIEERLVVVESLKKENEERFVVVKSKDIRIEERMRELEMKEKGLEERFKAVELREISLKDGLSELDVKKREVENGFRELKLRTDQVDKWCEDVELREEKVEECCGAVNLEKENIRKRCTEVLRKEKELTEWSQRLGVKERQIDQCLKELELKKKRIDERRESLELWEREINEGRPAPEWEETQVRMWCSEMVSKQKQVEGLLLELVVKETEMTERSKALDLKEKLVDEHCMAEELREKETDERCEEIEFEKGRIKEQVLELERRESEISVRLKEVELKESAVIEHSRALKLKEREIDGLNKDVESKHRGLVFEENRISRVRMELDRRKREQELKDNKLNEDIDTLKARERLINNRFLELNSTEAKMKELNTGFEELEAKKKLVKEYSDQINLFEKLIKDKELGLKYKEKQICESREALELKEKQNREHSEALKLRQKAIEEKDLTLELKETEFLKHCQEHESRVKLTTDVPLMDTEQLADELRVDDGETLQLLLNDRVDEHCFMGEAIRKALKSYDDAPGLVLSALNGFFPPHLRKCDVAYTTSTVRSSCVLLLEKLMNMRPEICCNVKTKAEDIACLWRRKMDENGESRIVVLGFLLLLVVYRLTPQFDRDELKRLWEIVDQHRLASRLRFELDLFEEYEENGVFSQPETGQGHSGSVDTDDGNLCSEIKSVCSNMDAKCLRSYLNYHVMDHKLFSQTIADALKSAPDPPMLVYKVLQTFNLPRSNTVNKTSCIILLEQLLKLQKYQPYRNPLGKIEQALNPRLHISKDMKINAFAFASRWKHRLTQDQEGLKPLEVYGFLLFLASFNITTIYDRDELLQLFKVLYDALPVYWPEENLHLCRALGLTKKIPCLIKSLIKEDNRLQAAKYICAFMEDHHFPLAPLLKDHVRFVQQRVEKIQGILGQCTEKVKATFELSNLRQVLQYIKEYKLEGEYSPVGLELRIKQLETVLADLKTVSAEASERPLNLPAIKSKNNGGKLDGPKKLDESVKNHSSDNSDSEQESREVTKRLASSPTSEFPEQGKRFRVEALKSLDRPNMTFKIPSQKNPFSSEKPQAMLPRQVLKSCPVRSAGKASSVEHSAQYLKTSPTRNSTPGAIYSVAVAPYGDIQT